MVGIVYADHYLEEIRGRDPMPVHERFFEMKKYLEKVAPAGKLAGRRHVDPLDLRKAMGFINLVDVEWEAGEVRFRYRLVGQEQTRSAGREYTGKLVHEALLPELVPRVLANMTMVLRIRGPVFDSFPIPHPNRQFIVSQRVYYPLADDGEQIDMLLTLHGYDPDPPLERA